MKKPMTSYDHFQIRIDKDSAAQSQSLNNPYLVSCLPEHTVVVMKAIYTCPRDYMKYAKFKRMIT